MDDNNECESVEVFATQVMLLGDGLLCWLRRAEECSDDSTRAEYIANAKESIGVIIDIAVSVVGMQQGDDE